MRKNNTAPEILSLQKDLESVYKRGKIVRLVSYPTNRVLDIMLDATVTKDQALDISRYIKTNYQVDALFYQKGHLIKVVCKT